jgi:nucleotide-binding universal stress UspA family protein
MARPLLVPLTDSEDSWPALEYALDHFPDAYITLVNVVDPAGAGYGERSENAISDEDTAEAEAEELFETADELADGYDATLDRVIVEGQPAEMIVEVAEQRGVDTIIMGSRGRTGVSRALLGSVAGTVIQNDSIPVTVVP